MFRASFASLRDARKINKDIVCCHLTAYGREGGRATWPGYDYLMQAETGWFSLTGEPDTPPARFGLSVVDLMTGLLQAYATSAAILGARTEGKGRDIDVSLFDLALSNLSYPATWYLNSGHVQGREPRSGHPSLTPCGAQKTKDGWIFLMCNKEKFWPILCDMIGHSEWGRDPKFATFKERLKDVRQLPRCWTKHFPRRRPKIGLNYSPARSRPRQSSIFSKRWKTRSSPRMAKSRNSFTRVKSIPPCCATDFLSRRSGTGQSRTGTWAEYR